MKILLVEDEEAIRGFVRINLKRSDMEPMEASSGEQALQLVAQHGPPDIALLDIMLPGISGLEVCSALREAYPTMGIIMLTAKSQEQDKIQGLELGADDYVQKPFSPGELMARIRSLARRMRLPDPADPDAATASSVETNGELEPNVGAVAASPVETNNEREYSAGALQEPAGPNNGRFIPLPELCSAKAAGSHESALLPGDEALQVADQHPQSAAVQTSSDSSTSADDYKSEPVPPHDIRYYGAFSLSDSERRFWKNDGEILLTPTEWSLVKLLLDRYGQSVSRDEILTEVWGRYYAGDLKVVDVNIRRIRQKVEADPSEPVIIETVWGFGYRWYRGAAR
ncbi:Transcriptional regulatory protein, C terminal [Paenibacillaceae bacterium GAS479]|nr:Transcriptional regulatory protein, C terminal [Paenibacillaceae bacterium GAS479]